jgi:hydroxyacylglutathione hydrolase
LKLETFVCGPVQTNVYLIWNEETCEAALIDPGMGSEDAGAAAAKIRLVPKYIFNTHAHFDHTWLNAYYKKLWPDAQLVYNKLEEPMLDASGVAAQMFGFPAPEASPHADVYCEEGDVFKLGGEELSVLHLPGHTPGHIGLVTALGIFSGDVLFQGSIGRCDLPGGDEAQLLQTIREKLLVLPDTTVIFTGHGPSTTIGMEKAINPFLN